MGDRGTGPTTVRPDEARMRMEITPLRRDSPALTQLWVLTARQLRLTYRDRRIALFGVAQPLIMLLLFSQIFGSIADPATLPDGVGYIDFLLPALLVTTGIGTSQGAGVGLVRDMEGGMVRRFRGLPMMLPLALVARSLADLTRSFVQLLVLLLSGTLLFGFAPPGGPWRVGAALALSTLVVWALIWIFIALATWLRSIEVLGSIGFFVSFPLMFASSAFVPLAVLPGWLQVVATFNPITYAVDASRHLALGLPVGSGAVAAVAISVVVITLTMYTSIRAFRRNPDE